MWDPRAAGSALRVVSRASADAEYAPRLKTATTAPFDTGIPLVGAAASTLQLSPCGSDLAPAFPAGGAFMVDVSACSQVCLVTGFCRPIRRCIGVIMSGRLLKRQRIRGGWTTRQFMLTTHGLYQQVAASAASPAESAVESTAGSASVVIPGWKLKVPVASADSIFCEATLQGASADAALQIVLQHKHAASGEVVGAPTIMRAETREDGARWVAAVNRASGLRKLAYATPSKVDAVTGTLQRCLVPRPVVSSATGRLWLNALTHTTAVNYLQRQAVAALSPAQAPAGCVLPSLVDACALIGATASEVRQATDAATPLIFCTQVSRPDISASTVSSAIDAFTSAARRSARRAGGETRTDAAIVGVLNKGAVAAFALLVQHTCDGDQATVSHAVQYRYCFANTMAEVAACASGDFVDMSAWGSRLHSTPSDAVAAYASDPDVTDSPGARVLLVFATLEVAQGALSSVGASKGVSSACFHSGIAAALPRFVLVSAA